MPLGRAYHTGDFESINKEVFQMVIQMPLDTMTACVFMVDHQAQRALDIDCKVKETNHSYPKPKMTTRLHGKAPAEVYKRVLYAGFSFAIDVSCIPDGGLTSRY